jgi:hypothetical protein
MVNWPNWFEGLGRYVRFRPKADISFVYGTGWQAECLSADDQRTRRGRTAFSRTGASMKDNISVTYFDTAMILLEGRSQAERVPSPDGKRAMISSKKGSRDIEIDLATGRPLRSMTHVFDVGPLIKARGEPVAGYFAAYGSYYLTRDQTRALRWNEDSPSPAGS